MWWQRKWSLSLWSSILGPLFFLCPPWLCPIPWRASCMCVWTPQSALLSTVHNSHKQLIITYSLGLWSHSGSRLPWRWWTLRKGLPNHWKQIWGHLSREFRDSGVQGNYNFIQKGSLRSWVDTSVCVDLRPKDLGNENNWSLDPELYVCQTTESLGIGSINILE